MTPAHDYARDHAERFKNQLIDLLKIPSISTLTVHAPDVERAAQWLIDDMQKIGMTRAETFQQDGFLPLVYAEWLGAGEDAPTVLVYCHYDVQPAEISDGWDTNPFEPVERDGKIYARGAVDSKSHVLINLKAVEAVIASGNAPCNIKLLFEGEEESGSEHIFAFVEREKDLLTADAIIVSDGSLPAIEQPILDYGLRGIISMEVTVRGPARDLHSGHYGGSVHNPIQALIEILATLHDDDGRITVDGFYDDVIDLSDEERAMLDPMASFTEQEWWDVTGAKMAWGEPGYRLHERIGARPTLEFNGITGGFQGEGVKTVLPAKASVKITCRLVPDQDPQRVYKVIREHLKRVTPPTVSLEMDELEMGARGVLLDRHSIPFNAAYEAYTRGWGVAPIYTREGGSVPVVEVFQRVLDAPIVMLPYGYKGCGAHGPNEHVYLEMFNKGIATAIHFYQILPDIM